MDLHYVAFFLLALYHCHLLPNIILRDTLVHGSSPDFHLNHPSGSSTITHHPSLFWPNWAYVPLGPLDPQHHWRTYQPLLFDVMYGFIGSLHTCIVPALLSGVPLLLTLLFRNWRVCVTADQFPPRTTTSHWWSWPTGYHPGDITGGQLLMPKQTYCYTADTSYRIR